MTWHNGWLAGQTLAALMTKLFARRPGAARRRPSQKIRLRLVVEEMEGRVLLSVASPLLTTSSNWSGYASQTNLNTPQSGAVTAVGGSWIVPTVSGSVNAYSSAWVGLDGYSSNTVEQLGTEQDTSVKGKTTYYAWYETYPSDSVVIPNFAVAPGDLIAAVVSYSAGAFTLQITDTPLSGAAVETFSITKSAKGAQQSSAEWIMEAPSSNSVLPLANFGTVNFSNAWATISGVTGPVDNSTWQTAQINMVGGSGRRTVTEDTTSGLTDGTLASSDRLPPPSATTVSSFNVTFNSATTTTPQPTPPGRRHGHDPNEDSIIIPSPVTATVANSLLIVYVPPSQNVITPTIDINQAVKAIDSSGITRLGVWHESTSVMNEADNAPAPANDTPQAPFLPNNPPAPRNNNDQEQKESTLPGAAPSTTDIVQDPEVAAIVEKNALRPQPDLESLAATAGLLLFLQTEWRPEEMERKKQRRVIPALWPDW